MDSLLLLGCLSSTISPFETVEGVEWFLVRLNCLILHFVLSRARALSRVIDFSYFFELRHLRSNLASEHDLCRRKSGHWMRTSSVFQKKGIHSLSTIFLADSFFQSTIKSFNGGISIGSIWCCRSRGKRIAQTFQKLDWKYCRRWPAHEDHETCVAKILCRRQMITSDDVA